MNNIHYNFSTICSLISHSCRVSEDRCLPLTNFRSHFFYHDKSWNGKRYPFANDKMFCHLQLWKVFVIWGEIQLKSMLQTLNLQKYKFLKQFWLNLLYPTTKSFPNQMAKTFANEYTVQVTDIGPISLPNISNWNQSFWAQIQIIWPMGHGKLTSIGFVEEY